MQIFNDKKERIGNLQRFTNRSITTTLSSGDKELSFEYPAHGNMVDKLQAEYYIRTETDEYVLKSIEEGETLNKYLAVLNVEELEGTVFPTGYESVEQTIRACLEFAFEDAGWKVGNCDITKKRTVRIDDHTTAWEVLQQALSTYRCECIINSLTKTVDIYEQVGSDKGCYFIEGLNLRKLTLKTDTYDFYTRIYPMGKDGITPFEAIGKPYLDNFQYSTKVKAYVWKDERYTVTTNLIEDAKAKLEEMSKPYRAFTADVVDLARMSKKYKEILSYGIGDTITLISKKTRIKEKQRIVKITEYPEKPEKNTVEISNARKTFAELQKTESELSKAETISKANSLAKKMLIDDYYTKKEVDSCISAAADKIKLSVGETYVTYEAYKKGIQEAKNDATEKADAAESNAKVDTDEKLKSYSTTTEMQSAIKLVSESITSTVSKTYVTNTTYTTGIQEVKNDATEKANAAESNAKADTIEKLKNYSTTTEMQSAIKQTAKNIESTVSKKVDAKEIISTINQSAEKVAIKASKINLEGIVTANKRFKILDNGSFECDQGTIGNFTVKNGSIFAEGTELSVVEKGFKIKGGLKIHCGGSSDFSDLSDTFQIFGVGHVTSGRHLMLTSDTSTVTDLSSSSRRYKNHVADITENEAKKILKITPVWFRYKEGYLVADDQLNGENIPGFYAEDVAEAIPVITWKNSSGDIENWDERRIIPFMLKLIQILYNKMEVQS